MGRCDTSLHEKWRVTFLHIHAPLHMGTELRYVTSHLSLFNITEKIDVQSLESTRNWLKIE